MSRILPPALAFSLLLAGPALAQLQSGPNAPSVGGQLPPTQMPRDQASPPQSAPATGAPNTQQRDHIRTEPPPGHQTLSPPRPQGAERPDRSTGMFDTQSPVPERPGARPDATETGRPDRR